jgi:hypothetical protein
MELVLLSELVMGGIVWVWICGALDDIARASKNTRHVFIFR